MRDMGAGVLELADEIGMEPQQDDTPASRDDPAWTIAHGEEGDVPRNDDSNHLPDAIDSNTHGDRRGDTENEQYDSGSGDIRGDIRGADNMDEHIGGAEHYDGDGIGRVGDDNGDHHQSRGNTAEGEPTVPGRPDPPKAGARLLDFFRTGGTDLAMLSIKLGSEQAMNITVREAIRTRVEEAERVILKELAQIIIKNVWTPMMADC
jgi:hypothetical protein